MEGDSSFILLRRIHSEWQVIFLWTGEEAAIRSIESVRYSKILLANRRFFSTLK